MARSGAVMCHSAVVASEGRWEDGITHPIERRGEPAQTMESNDGGSALHGSRERSLIEKAGGGIRPCR